VIARRLRASRNAVASGVGPGNAAEVCAGIGQLGPVIVPLSGTVDGRPNSTAHLCRRWCALRSRIYPGSSQTATYDSFMSSGDGRKLDAILVAQRRFLETSCTAFDEGHEEEAVRLTVTLRVLAHDTGASHSLLSQIGVKTQWRYWNLRLPPPSQEFWGGHLLVEASARPNDGSRSSSSTITQPVSDRGESFWSDFDFWWTSEVSRVQGYGFTRKDFVLVLANKEGGAHVDTLTQSQEALAEDVSGWQTDNLGIGTYARMTVRAIAEEMRQTIDVQFSRGQV
jgi:hypothetical protein